MRKTISPEFLFLLVILLAVLAILWPVISPFNRLHIDNTPLSEQVKSKLGVDLADLKNSLTLTPVITGEEPFILTYMVPSKVEAATMSGYIPTNRTAAMRLLALMDNGKDAYGYDIERQTNGTYLVKWYTKFASYGTHALHSCLFLPWTGAHRVDGPERTETVTDILQWEYDGFGFGRTRTWFHGWLHTPADYRIEIYDTNSVLMKTLDATNKRMINEIWDYKPGKGQPYSAEDFTAKVLVRPAFARTSNAIKASTNWILYSYP